MDSIYNQPLVKLYTFFSGEWVPAGQGVLDVYEVKNPSKAAAYERQDYTLIKIVVFSDRDMRVKLFKDHIKRSSEYSVLNKTILHKSGRVTRAISFANSTICSQVFLLISKAVSGQLSVSLNSTTEDELSSSDTTTLNATANLSTSVLNMNALDVSGVISINKNNEIPVICRENLSAWLTIVNCYHAVLNRNSTDSFMEGADKDGYAKILISMNMCAPYAEAFCVDFGKDNMLEEFLAVYRSVVSSVDETRERDLFKLFSIFRLLVTFNSLDFLELLFAEPDKVFEMLGVFRYDPSREEQVDHQEFFSRNNCLQYGWISEQLTAAGVALTESIKNSSFVNDKSGSIVVHEESSKLSIMTVGSYKELVEKINKKIEIIQYTSYILKRVLPTTKMFDSPYVLQSYCANLKNELCGVICENLIILESILQNFFTATTKLCEILNTNESQVERLLAQTANTLSFLNEFSTMCNDFTDNDKSAIYEWLLNYPLLKKLFHIMNAALTSTHTSERIKNYFLLNTKLAATFVYKLVADAYVTSFYPFVLHPVHEISSSSCVSESHLTDPEEDPENTFDAIETLFDVLIKYFEYNTVSQIVINTINVIIGPSPQCMSMSNCDNMIDGFDVDENGDYPEKSKLLKSNFMSNFVKVLEKRFEAVFFKSEKTSDEMKVKFLIFCTNYLVSEHYQRYNIFSGENKLIQRFIADEGYLLRQSDIVIVELTRFLITAFKLNEISLYQQMVAYKQGLLGCVLSKVFIDRCSRSATDSMLSNSLLNFFAFIVEKNVIVLINHIVNSEMYDFERELLAASRGKFYTGLFGKMYRVYQANRRKRASMMERSALEASENDKVINKHNELSDSQVQENWFEEDSASEEDEEKVVQAEEAGEEEFEVPKTHGEKENDEETESVLDKVELAAGESSGHASPVERKKSG